MGVKAVLLRHDAPARALPQVDVQLTVPDEDRALLIPLSKAVTCLPRNVFHQRIQLLRRQLALHLTLRHAP